MSVNGNNQKELSFRQSFSMNFSSFLRFQFKPCWNDIHKLNSYSIISITLTILILYSSANFCQTNSLHYQRYSYTPITSDSINLTLGSQAIPQVTGWDIGGQFALSLISGTLFAVGGGLIGNSLSSHQNEINNEGIVGILLGYTVGTSIGIYAAASNKKYDPKFLALLGSSILGELTGILLYTLSNADTPNTNILAFAPLVLPPVFTIITLNSFQQKKSNVKIGFDVQQLPHSNICSYGIKLLYQF